MFIKLKVLTDSKFYEETFINIEKIDTFTPNASTVFIGGEYLILNQESVEILEDKLNRRR